MTGHSREQQFARLMRRRGVTLVPQPRTFRFGRSSYRPDFHDPASGDYYEVIGTRQRGFTIRYQLDLMAAYYPKITLHVVRPDGSPFETHAGLRTIDRDGQDIGSRLRAVLTGLGLSTRTAAARSGVAHTTIKKASRGEPISGFVAERLRVWMASPEERHERITRFSHRGRNRITAKGAA